MSLRQVIQPCRGQWMSRVQPKVVPRRTNSFSTAAVSQGHCSRRGFDQQFHSKSHHYNTNTLKDEVLPIKRRAKKAVFVDSKPPSSSSSTSSSSSSPSSTTSSGTTTTSNIGAESSESTTPIFSHAKQTFNNNSKGKKDQQPHQEQQQTYTYDASQAGKERAAESHHTRERKHRLGRPGRLTYEDLFPRHYRQSRQRQLHQLRKENHHHHNHHNHHNHHKHKHNAHNAHGGHGGHGDHANGPHQDPSAFWWMWHMMESRKTIFRSFFAGIFITGGIYKAYTAYDKSTKKHEWLSFAQEMMKARLSFLESGEQPLRHNRAEAIPFIPAQRFNNHNSTTLGGGGFGKIPPASMMSPFHLGDILHPLPLPPSLGLLGSDKELKMLTPELVEIRLGQNQKSVKLQNPDPQHRPGRARSNLVQGYSINQLASNNPIEDDLSTHVVRNHEGAIEKLFFGVFDGHSGWCCSQKVAQELAPSVAKELDQLRSLKDKAQVSKAIERGFLKLDQRIVQDSVQRVLEHGTRPLACSSLLPAISGSCAILAYVDERERDLYVACTGDSRAVMGVREPLPEGGGHVWRAVPLSADQTGRSKSEIKRMQLEHPGEEKTVVSRGRVLGGLEPTRSFGDARYKWTKEIQDKVFSLFPAYREPRPNYNTPPYVTAKPVVRHHKIQSEDRFMVMATDGLWDKLTSDEVVQLVGSLLDGKTGQEEMVLDREEIHRYRQKRRAILAASTPQSSAQKQVQQMDDEDEDEVTPANLAPKGPASQARRFTYRDQANVATHLIRNAIGGADDDKVAATLSIPSPISRSYRDDITVTVLFFEEQGTTLALSSAQAADKDLVEIL